MEREKQQQKCQRLYGDVSSGCVQILWRHVLTGHFLTPDTMQEPNLQTSWAIIASCMCSHCCHGEDLGTFTPWTIQIRQWKKRTTCILGSSAEVIWVFVRCIWIYCKCCVWTVIFFLCNVNAVCQWYITHKTFCMCSLCNMIIQWCLMSEHSIQRYIRKRRLRGIRMFIFIWLTGVKVCHTVLDVGDPGRIKVADGAYGLFKAEKSPLAHDKVDVWPLQTPVLQVWAPRCTGFHALYTQWTGSTVRL